MAVTEEAGHALGLIAGIDICHHPEQGYWRSMAVRLVMDLDEAGQPGAVAVVLATLREQWGLFATDRYRAKPLAEIPEPFSGAVIAREDLPGLDGLAIDGRLAERLRDLLGEVPADGS